MGDHELRWTFHSTAMVADYDAAISTLGRYFGLRVLEYSESTIPEVGRRGGMTWVGDNSIEIGQPLVAGAGAAKFVERNGGGVHSVAVQVTDVEATIEHLGTLGVAVAARPDPHFFFSDPKTTGGVFFEWADIEVDEDPRFGAPEPAFDGQPLLEVAHHAFIGAVVDEPMAWAERFCALLGTELTFDDPSAGPGAPRVGLSLKDQTLALFALPGDRSVELWGRSYGRSRTHLIGLSVPDLDAATAQLEAVGVGLVRRTADLVVVDPRATGDVQVALVERLLPGDPRPGR
jgi:catechol 2,3-dioxygenase-like lactoylglutathione lyase family enzyme